MYSEASGQQKCALRLKHSYLFDTFWQKQVHIFDIKKYLLYSLGSSTEIDINHLHRREPIPQNSSDLEFGSKNKKHDSIYPLIALEDFLQLLRYCDSDLPTYANLTKKDPIDSSSSSQGHTKQELWKQISRKDVEWRSARYSIPFANIDPEIPMTMLQGQSLLIDRLTHIWRQRSNFVPSDNIEDKSYEIKNSPQTFNLSKNMLIALSKHTLHHMKHIKWDRGWGGWVTCENDDLFFREGWRHRFSLPEPRLLPMLNHQRILPSSVPFSNTLTVLNTESSVHSSRILHNATNEKDRNRDLGSTQLIKGGGKVDIPLFPWIPTDVLFLSTDNLCTSIATPLTSYSRYMIPLNDIFSFSRKMNGTASFHLEGYINSHKSKAETFSKKNKIKKQKLISVMGSGLPLKGIRSWTNNVYGKHNPLQRPLSKFFFPHCFFSLPSLWKGVCEIVPENNVFLELLLLQLKGFSKVHLWYYGKLPILRSPDSGITSAHSPNSSNHANKKFNPLHCLERKALFQRRVDDWVRNTHKIIHGRHSGKNGAWISIDECHLNGLKFQFLTFHHWLSRVLEYSAICLPGIIPFLCGKSKLHPSIASIMSADEVHRLFFLFFPFLQKRSREISEKPQRDIHSSTLADLTSNHLRDSKFQSRKFASSKHQVGSRFLPDHDGFSLPMDRRKIPQKSRYDDSEMRCQIEKTESPQLFSKIPSWWFWIKYKEKSRVSRSKYTSLFPFAERPPSGFEDITARDLVKFFSSSYESFCSKRNSDNPSENCNSQNPFLFADGYYFCHSLDGDWLYAPSASLFNLNFSEASKNNIENGSCFIAYHVMQEAMRWLRSSNNGNDDLAGSQSSHILSPLSDSMPSDALSIPVVSNNQNDLKNADDGVINQPKTIYKTQDNMISQILMPSSKAIFGNHCSICCSLFCKFHCNVSPEKNSTTKNMHRLRTTSLKSTQFEINPLIHNISVCTDSIDFNSPGHGGLSDRKSLSCLFFHLDLWIAFSVTWQRSWKTCRSYRFRYVLKELKTILLSNSRYYPLLDLLYPNYNKEQYDSNSDQNKVITNSSLFSVPSFLDLQADNLLCKQERGFESKRGLSLSTLQGIQEYCKNSNRKKKNDAPIQRIHKVFDITYDLIIPDPNKNFYDASNRKLCSFSRRVVPYSETWHILSKDEENSVDRNDDSVNSSSDKYNRNTRPNVSDQHSLKTKKLEGLENDHSNSYMLENDEYRGLLSLICYVKFSAVVPAILADSCEKRILH